MADKKFRVVLSIYEKGMRKQTIHMDDTKTKSTIGRSRENDICILDSQVSGKHCELLIHKGRLMVKDLRSTNGTFVNQNRIGRKKEPSDRYVYLEDGDLLELSENVQIDVHCVLTGAEERKHCEMCGVPYDTSTGSEFCPGCRYEMAKNLGMFPNRKPEYVEEDFFREEEKAPKENIFPEDNRGMLTLEEYFKEKMNSYLGARYLLMELLASLDQIHDAGEVNLCLVPGGLSIIFKEQGRVKYIYQDRQVLESERIGYQCRQQRMAEQKKEELPFREKVSWDVWAAAAIIYHLLTGNSPRNKAGQIVPIWVYDPNVPVELAYILDRALNEEETLYYSSARKMAMDLSKIEI